MKKHVAKAALVAFAVVGAAVPDAFAVSTTHAAAFHAFSSPQAADFVYNTNSVYHTATTARGIIAPVNFDFPAGVTGNAKFYVDGTVAIGGSLTFTLYAWNYDGAFVSSANTTVSTSGVFDKLVTLTSVNADDYVSLFSSMPATSNTRFYGVISVGP